MTSDQTPDVSPAPGASAASSAASSPNEAGGPSPAASTRRHRRLFALGAAVAILLVLGGVLAVVRYLPALDEARTLRADLEAMVDGVRASGLDIDREKLDSLDADLAAADVRFERIESLVTGDPLVAVARVLPVTGPSVRGADGIVSAAGDMLDAVGEGLVIGRGFVEVREGQAADRTGASVLPKLLELMASSRDHAVAADALVTRAKSALETVPGDAVGPIRDIADSMTDRIDKYGPMLSSYVDASDRIPSILGRNGPRRYLVLTQDPAEIRPTGGFIGSYGIVAFDRGRITEFMFRDISLLDEPQDYPAIEPPQDLGELQLGADRPWPLAQANWSPDFPTSAQDALRLYTNESGDDRIDGVIALTTYTIDELLKLTGPVTVPEYDVTIAPGESTLKILELTRTAATPEENRKAFLSKFADAVVPTLLAVQPRTWPGLLDTIDVLRRQHHLLAWMRHPADQALVEASGFGGSVRDGSGDFVYPVDSNVAPSTKLDLVTTRAWDLDVRIDGSGNARNTLGVTWDNAVEAPRWEAYRALQGVGGRILGMYSRLLVPERSRVEAVSGGSVAPVTTPAVVRTEAGRLSLGAYVEIPPGETRLRWEWTSPNAAATEETGGTYRLLVQKQPGIVPGPITLRIHAPEGYRISTVSPSLTIGGDGAVATLTATFAEDIVVSLRYDRP